MSEEEILTKGKENKAKLLSSKFRQQTIKEYRPNPTLCATLITFLVSGIFFLALGIILVCLADNIKEVSITYHDEGVNTNPCLVNFEIKEKMKKTVYVYYELENFYQNHRRYVKSRNDAQLAGKVLSPKKLSSGDPITTVKELGFSKTLSNKKLNDDDPANPGGLIAKSFFNDTYELFHDGKKIDINEKGIAWSTDKEDLFKRPSNYKDIQWIDVKDEHFIVWMRVAGFSDFKKPWGRIEQDLEPGNYTLSIDNQYDVLSFDGKKKFFLSTSNSYGGKNEFLYIGYLVVGGLGVGFSLVFLCAYMRQKKIFKNKKR